MVVVTQVKYIVALVVVSSVIAVLVADVAVVALPDNAPENVVVVNVPVFGLKVSLLLDTF